MTETYKKQEVGFGCVDPGWLVVIDEMARTAQEAALRKQYGPGTRVEVRTPVLRASQLGG